MREIISRSFSSTSLKHRRRASVSILLVIVVPPLLLMGLFLYDLLLMRHREAKALKIVYAVSEAKLAQFNEYLDKERGIQANLDIGTTSEYFSFYLLQNGFSRSAVQVELRRLNQPEHFEQAILRSMFINVGNAALEKILEKLGIIDVVKDMAEKLESLDKKLEELYSVLEFPKTLLRYLNASSISEVETGVKLIQNLLEEREETFYEKKQSVEQDLSAITHDELRNDKRAVVEQLVHTWNQYGDDVRSALSKIAEFYSGSDSNHHVPIPLAGTLQHEKRNVSSNLSEKAEEEVIASIRAQFRDWNFYQHNDGNSGILGQIKKGLAIIKKSLGAFASEAGVLSLQNKDYTSMNYQSYPNVLEKMALVEWVVRNTSSYAKGSQKKRSIRGEAEYIITGKANEQDSVSRIRLEIAGIRLVPNMITFSKSQVKEQITQVLGVLPPPLNYVALGIAYSAVVLGESYIDSGRLLQGDEFGFVKDETEWRLSLDGLTRGAFEELTKATEKQKKKDKMRLDYLDYLRVLLLLESPKNIVLRSMNVVEAGILAASGNTYTLSDYATGHKVRVQFTNKSIITEREAEIEFENSYD